MEEERLVSKSKIRYTYSMPITKQAIKKLRHDRDRSVERSKTEEKLHILIKGVRKNPTQKSLTAVFSALDKAGKTHIIHPNRAGRLKSRLSKLLKK